MDIALIVLSSISAIILFFYFFTYIKSFKIARYILSSFLIVFIGALFSLLIFQYLPDSKHIFTTTISAYSALLIGHIFMLFQEKTIFRYIGRLFYLLLAAVWIQLYFSTFYLYHIPNWITISASIFYILVFAATEIFLRSKSLIVNLWVIIYSAVFMFMNYCGFTTMCMAKTLYSILLFAGSTVLLLTLIYNILEFGGRFVKHTEPAKLILLLISQALISSAGVLMIR